MEQQSIDWGALKPEIWQLYLAESKTLVEVVAAIKAARNIRITPDQLEYKLKQWRFRKNLPPKVWKYVAHQICQRTRVGKKNSQVVCGDVVLPTKKVNKAIARYAKTLQGDSLTPPNNSNDFQIIVQTPPSDSVPHMWPGNMPWLSFMNAFDYLLEPFSQVELDSRLFSTLRRSIDGVAVKLWGGAAFAPMPLHNLMSTEDGRQKVQQSSSVARCRENSKEVLELLLFLLSNNTPGVVYWCQALDHFTASLLRQTRVLQSSLKEMIDSGHSSALALRDQLWAAALRVSDLPAIRELLTTGVDLNKPVALKYLAARPVPAFGHSPASFAAPITALPLQVAICSREKGIADLLISCGANLAEAIARTSLLEFASFRSSRGLGFSTSGEFLDQILQHHRDEITAEDWIEATKTFTPPGDTESARCLLKFYCDNMLSSQWLRPEALIYAIRNHLDSFVHFFLQNGSDVNALTRANKSALWEAVYVERSDVCNLLFDHGAVAQPDRHEIPCPLQCAAFKGNKELVRLLLSKGADVNRLNQPEAGKIHSSRFILDKLQVGRTALEAALYGEQPGIALMLLDVGAKIIGSELTIAIRQRLPSLVKRFLDMGLPFPGQPDDQESALEVAIIMNQIEVASAILSLRPYLYEPSALCAVVHMEVVTNDASLLELILERRNPCHPEISSYQSENALEGTALAIAAFFGRSHIVRLLLNHGIRSPICLFPEIMELPSPNSIRYCPCEKHNESAIDAWGEEGGWWRSSLDRDSYTKVVSPLEAAVAGGNTAAISLLLCEGYEIDQHSLATAAQVGNHDILEMLMSHKPDLVTKKSNLRLALNAAVQGGHVDVVRRLLEAGVEINELADGPDAVEWSYVYFQGSPYAYRPNTALQAAVGAGNQGLVDLLISHGANVHAPAAQYDGATALQLASMQGLLSIARKLFNQGVSCNEEAAKPRGRTALEGSAEHGRLDMIQLLLSHGVETTGAHRVQFIRAVQLAAQNAHYAVTELLRGIRAWDDEDDRLFSELEHQRPTAPSTPFDYSLSAMPAPGDSNAESIEPRTNARTSVSDASPWPWDKESIWAVPNAVQNPTSSVPGLIHDQTLEAEDGGSESSAKTGSADHVTGNLYDEPRVSWAESSYNGKDIDLEDGNFFTSFLEDFHSLHE
ncbi:ankyrin repeat-containing domain protein [Immersiella caudata]|uniref:Ankyrin repeat-containing domain protein n=1 Tax=Immersiella caudata TaxID=314043 RepID=A0AA39WFE1_9PEZI|nr:ankyrin repeat-containing domain protein [Immersiella caudata]